MTMEALPAGTTVAHPLSSFHPFTALSGFIDLIVQRRRQKAEIAMLMALDPHVLADMGVSIVAHPYDGGPRVQRHPAVLATTFGLRPD